MRLVDEEKSFVRKRGRGDELTGDDGGVWMPTRVANARLPVLTAAAFKVHVIRVLAAAGPRVVRCLFHVDLTCDGGVHVVDVDGAVLAARVDVTAVGAAGRAEVAADQGFEHAVAAEGDDAAVVCMRAVFVQVVFEAVVEAA